ncbi:MAG: hypothetical protein QXX35_03490 [Desulfurococcaceae archaeon]
MLNTDYPVFLKEKIIGLLKGINYEDPLVKYRGLKALRLTQLISGQKVDLPISIIIDVFYTLYLPFISLKNLDEIPKDKKQYYFLLDSLLKSSFIHVIKSRTVLDTLMSCLATGILIPELKRILEDIGRKSSEIKSSIDYEKEVKKEIDRTLSSLSKDLDNVKKLRSLIEGDQAGSLSMIAYEEYGPELVKLARNIEVRKILEQLTGVKPWMFRIEKRRQRFKHGEILGYEFGRDIERIVPSNLLLPNELFYIKYLNNKLLLYQKAVTEGKGSLYVLVDKSGSMDGVKITWAKAVALSLYMRAIRENRDFYFRFFDSIPYSLCKVERRRRVKQALRLIEYIASVKGSGGTDITRSIVTACSDIRSSNVSGVNDIVLITDGVDRIAEQVVRYNLKKANARLITVMIMGDNESLRKVSAKYFTVIKLSQKDILQVVEVD